MCINFYSYSNDNNMKIKIWTVFLRKARNHCQDVDNCQYHIGIDHCQDGNRDRDPSQNGNVHADNQDQWSALKYI